MSETLRNRNASMPDSREVAFRFHADPSASSEASSTPVFQDKIKREKPPHDDAPVSFSPVADVLNSKRPGRSPCRKFGTSFRAVEGNYIGFDRRPLFDQCLHETQRRHSLGIEVMTELRPRENSTVETNKRNPFRLPARPT